VVSRGTVVLSQWKSSEPPGAALNEILQRLDPNTNANMSFANPDKSAYHIIVHKGLVFLCWASEKVDQKRAFAFLADIKKMFLAQYKDEWKTAPARRFDGEFAKYMEKQARQYSDPAFEKIDNVKTELEATRTVLLQNIETLMERGQVLEDLDNSSAQLALDADSFRTKSKNLASIFWWQNMKLWFIIFGVAAVVIFVIVWIACGFPTFSNCVAAAPPSPPPPSPISPTPTP